MCWLAFEAGFVFVFVLETKNKTLEETAALFDGEDVVQQIADAGEQVANTDLEEPNDEKLSRSGIESYHKPSGDSKV